jgi:predicted Zn-dependent protease
MSGATLHATGHATPHATSALTSRAHFEALAEGVCGLPVAGSPGGDLDHVSLFLSAESSDFLRFNHSALRQATQVLQAHATLAVVRGARRAESTLTLTGDARQDIARLRAERQQLAADLAVVADDPWLLLPTTAQYSLREDPGALPEAAAVIDAVVRHAAGHDLVGFHAAGPVVRAYADSLGSRHWHRVESFHFDWCLYDTAHGGDKAVKTAYAGTHWDEALFEARLQQAAERAALLRRAPLSLPPGAYRAAFSPAAMNELLGALAWSGFSLKARRTGVSSLSLLERGEAALHPQLRISEATACGIAPAFTADGFVKPAEVLLVEGGRAAGTLNSPRSAREYGLPTNGAGPDETPQSLALAPGTIPEGGLLEALGTGLYVSNLWYLNYSDRQACRMTGMTRFACFWVEDGRLAAPLQVMRFDDSFLRLFGEGLVGLTDRAEQVPESGSYQSRQLASITTPAAVVEGWRLTL